MDTPPYSSPGRTAGIMQFVRQRIAAREWPPGARLPVPTGLALKGNQIYMSQAGPVPHLPVNGKVLALNKNSLAFTTIASGYRLFISLPVKITGLLMPSC